ncbi:reverse transcriptase, putative [Ixodes scapularis]|uniref:Reverse transcriptase, putative n=1 Tax=Ixodes scapularis TaxID=6945 RepID=B7P3Y9_IXOSC|nr:reverse transcriptase, putative [Ixodes scapularis]|eukprot:XP_002404862.1 reverse transcriptase, putative [Ixodes scapularis]
MHKGPPSPSPSLRESGRGRRATGAGPAVADNTKPDESAADSTELVEPLDTGSVLSEHTRNLRRLLGETTSDAAWATFTAILGEALEVVTRAVKLPAASSGRRPRREVNPNCPQQIQALYRRNRRRAVRLIVEGSSSQCPIPLEKIEAHFMDTWAPKEADTSLLTSRVPATAEMPMASFTEEEVAARLRRCESTAPGGDRLTYHHWKTVDPDACFLTAVYNICLRHRRVPAIWKETRTILIYKKGDRQDPTNWRPISLGCTIAKLYAGCLASRLQDWMSEHSVLSRCQKGFLPHDGVFEHNFVLQERLDRARTSGGQLCVAFLDFANAFGSVAHNALIEAVRGAGAGEAFASIVQDLYQDNITTVAAEEGTTEPISIAAGIRQGCPLSGLLFNLVLDPVIRAVQGGERRHNILAYADDLTPLADDPDMLQQRINTVAALSGRLGLKLNPAKCRTIHLTGEHPVGTRPTTFTIDESPIPTIGDFAGHSFLGRPVGYRVLADNATIRDAINLGKRLLTSVLAPWQRLDAVKTFLFPALNFAMRAGTLGKEDWRRLDETLRPLLKRTLYLPSNSSNEYLYGGAAAGAVGIPVAADISDACRIDGAFKLLSSPDPEIRSMALLAVTDITAKRLRRPAAEGDIEAYLTGKTEGDFRSTATQLKPVWTEARKASRRLGVSWELRPDGARIAFGETLLSPKHRHKVIRTLREVLMAEKNAALQQKPSQGKAMECVAADRTSSHFIRSGQFT